MAIDASDVGAGSVLLQDDSDIDHPICYYSKKFNEHQRKYSTIGKECLPLILALQHFEDYLASSVSPIVIFIDHKIVSEYDQEIPQSQTADNPE